jgi:hypothetical protein
MQTPYRNSFLTLTLVYTAFVVFTSILLMQAIPSSTAAVRRGALTTLILFLQVAPVYIQSYIDRCASFGTGKRVR